MQQSKLKEEKKREREREKLHHIVVVMLHSWLICCYDKMS
jgi:hypothetical protein